MAPFGASRAGLMSVAVDDIPDAQHYHIGDEGSGETIEDQEGSQNITLNGPSWESRSSFAGDLGVRFNRSNADEATATLTQGDSLTVMIRVKADSMSTSSPTFNTVFNHGSDFDPPYLVYDTDGTEWVFRYASGEDIRVTDSQTDVESNDRILAARRDANNAKLDVYDQNKNLIDSASATNGGTSWSSATTTFGNWGDNTREWDGLMDPNLIWDDSFVSDSQVSEWLSDYY